MNTILNYIFGGISLIGTVLTIFFGLKSHALEKRKKNLTWAELQLVIDAICFRLKRDGYTPDVILAPGPRGAIIAELIVQRFNRNIPALIGISYMEFTLKSMPSITNYFPFPISKGWQIYIPKTVLDYKDRRILVVDDFCLTGEFFEVLRTFLMDQGFIAGNVKVFCAVITEVTKSANRAPEYYHMVTGDDNFYFPWGKANTG